MKAVSVSGSLRENVGKKDARALRAKGLIPCVVYGGEKQHHIYVDEKQFKNLIYTPETNYAELSFGDIKTKAIIKESQFHPVTEKILHVDFLEITEDKAITVGIPVQITGKSPGVIRGGRLVKRYRKMKVNGFYTDIPDFITVDISKLEIGDSVYVEDVVVKNYTILENPSNVVVAVIATRNVEGEEGEEGEAEATAEA
ncbi:MAG: 50S ribosomal protein L25/general stress protein Ctc [Bacteroidales bacterium]|nr:50S ribosomal protein L25/general stress protein Ctc [Bacteroidales bacterium]